MEVYRLEDCRITLTGSDEWIEIKDGLIYIHRAEWEDPKVKVNLTQLKPKSGFEYWEKEGYK